MWLRSLSLADLRCYATATLEFAPGGNAIIGDNGVGKTSLLEAAYLLSRTLSFRGSPPAEVIRHRCSHALVVGEVQWADRTARVAVQRERQSSQIRVGSERDITIQMLARLLPIQVMDPRTHRVVEDGPIHRRRMLDWGVFHVEHQFLGAWTQFQRVLRQRNAACRRGDRRQRDAWTRSFLDTAMAVDTMRRDHLSAVAERWRRHVQGLLGEAVDPVLNYRPGWSSEMSLADALARSDDRELQVGHTVVGPHRADIALRLDGRQARHQASRGQQKALVLALMLAQAAEVRSATDEAPVLLIDDFGAEWGARLRGAAAQQLAASGCQWIATWLDEPEAGLPIERLFHVEQSEGGPQIRPVIN